MNVCDVQLFIRNLAELLYVSQKKSVPTEIESIVAALEPFKSEKVEKLAGFLKAVSEEYVRAGLISLPQATKGRSPKPTGKAKLFTKNDVPEIEKAVSDLHALCKRADDHT